MAHNKDTLLVALSGGITCPCAVLLRRTNIAAQDHINKQRIVAGGGVPAIVTAATAHGFDEDILFECSLEKKNISTKSYYK